MNRWRCISVVLLVILGSSVYPTGTSTVSAELSERDPNSIVPAEFAGDMEWSEQGNWHWVIYSYTGNNSTTGATIQPPYFVATKVRSLSSDDPCDDCLDLGGNQQGPPLVMGGTDNPRLGNAYESLSNGPRYRIAGNSGDSPTLWTAGAWYLNYNPNSGQFTSWTWIPDTQQGGASVPDDMDVDNIDNPPLSVSLEEMGDFMAVLPEGSRVFPLAPGTYRSTQAFGCVAHNHGYQSSGSCPVDRPSFHNGADFGAPEGTTIYAAASGTVTFSGIDSSSTSGNSAIRIEHDGVNSAFHSEYLHWIRSYVKTGDTVLAGQPIGEVGSVGYSTGPHLHFTVRDAANGVAIDPMVWLLASVTPIVSSISVDSAAVENVLRWEPFIRVAAAKHDVPPALIAAIMTVESSGNPNAVSPAGAQGLMQIMPMHLTRYGIATELWRDPATNIDAGARYLAESLSSGSTVQQTVGRYFGIGCDVLGTCTDQYVTRVLAWFAYYSALFAGDPLPAFPEAQVVATAQSTEARTSSSPQTPAQAEPGDAGEPQGPPQSDVPQPPEPVAGQEPPPEPAQVEEPAQETSADPPPESATAEQPSEEAPEESDPESAPESIPTETEEEATVDGEQSESENSGQTAETPDSEPAPDQEQAEVPEPEQEEVPGPERTAEPEATTGSEEPSPSADEDSGGDESQESAPDNEAAPDEANDVDEPQPAHAGEPEAMDDASEPVDETHQQSNNERPAGETDTPASDADSEDPEADDSSTSADVPDGGTGSTEQSDEVDEVTDVTPEVPDEDLVPEVVVPSDPPDPSLTEIEEQVTEVLERETSVDSSGDAPALPESVSDQELIEEEATETDPASIMDQPDSGIEGGEPGEGEVEPSDTDVPASNGENQLDDDIEGEPANGGSDDHDEGEGDE